MNRNLRDYELKLQADTLSLYSSLYPMEVETGDYSRRQNSADNYQTSIYYDAKKDMMVETEEYFYPI